MLEKTVTILADKGIHLQPATMISKFATEHELLNIRFSKGGREVAATSVMGILSLELARGSSVKVILARENKAAIEHIQNLLEGKGA